jgi:hypothetical protein
MPGHWHRHWLNSRPRRVRVWLGSRGHGPQPSSSPTSPTATSEIQLAYYSSTLSHSNFLTAADRENAGVHRSLTGYRPGSLNTARSVVGSARCCALSESTRSKRDRIKALVCFDS